MQIKVTAWNSFERTCVLQIHQVLIHWIIMYGMQRLRYTDVTHQSRPTLMELKNVVKAICAYYCLKAQINAAILLFRNRLQICKKQPLDISNILKIY